MTIDTITALKLLPLFRRLQPERLQSLARNCFVMEIPPGRMLQPQGKVPDSLFGVIKGQSNWPLRTAKLAGVFRS